MLNLDFGSLYIFFKLYVYIIVEQHKLMFRGSDVIGINHRTYATGKFVEYFNLEIKL